MSPQHPPLQHKPEVRIVMFAGMCVFFFLAHIGVRTKVVTQGYAIAGVRKDIARLESERAELKVARSRLRSPVVLEKLTQDLRARGKVFGPPENKQLIYLNREAP